MNNRKLTFCGIMAAMATVIMLVAYFPYVTYAVPCVASLAIMIVTVEYGVKAAFMTYLASALPVFLFCETETKLVYICFIGFYPALKCILERLKSRIPEYILKLVGFNAAVFVIYLVSTLLFGVRFDELQSGFRYIGIVFVVLANLAFVAYDFCISKMATIYLLRFHTTVARLLNKKKL